MARTFPSPLRPRPRPASGDAKLRFGERRPRRGRRWAVGIAATVVVLVAAFYLGGGWYFSGDLYHLGLSAEAKRAETPTYDVRVRAVGPTSITLALPSAEAEVTKQGDWGLLWPGGAGEAGAIERRSSGSITRAFHVFTGSPPRSGAEVAIDSTTFPVDPRVGLGLPFRTVDYRGPLGNYPAWFVPASGSGPGLVQAGGGGTTPAGSTWAIAVHGNSLSRLDCLKIVPVLHRDGLPVLLISYRNDPGAPPDPSGQMRYGQTEWTDLQAAVRYALGHGARSVVLVGYSMGGSIVTSFLERSRLASAVRGVILDDPMLDFSQTVDLGATEQRLPFGLPLPQSLTDVAKWLASVRYGVNWGALDYLAGAGRLRAPILLFQGTEDTTVPPPTSDELARLRPDLVTYLRVPGANHLEEWNLDPARYDAEVTSFLDRLPG